MPYTHFRAITYEVPTAAGYQGAVKSGWDPGSEHYAIPRLPVPTKIDGDESNDARNRLLRLAAVVDKAEKWVKKSGADNSSTLKIFVVPEFYFRPPVINKDYDSNTYPLQVWKGIITALDGMFADDAFKDWLFICGTILWNSPNPELDLGPEDSEEGKRIHWNTALWIRGGTAKPKHTVQFFEKHLPSGIDGVPLGFAPAGIRDVKLVIESWAERKNHMFVVGGVPMGVEVCLDHLVDPQCKVLKRVREDWQTNQRSVQTIKIHVLSCGGMQINPASVAADVDGFIIRNDGLVSSRGQSQLMQVTGYVEGTDWHAEFRPGDATAELTGISAEAAVDLPAGVTGLQVAIPANYQVFRQRLVFFPVKQI